MDILPNTQNKSVVCENFIDFSEPSNNTKSKLSKYEIYINHSGY
jgi:hypothetical protein